MTKTGMTDPNAYTVEITAPDISPYRKGNTGIDYATTIDSGKPGPHVMLTALAHGNEICGAIVLDDVLLAGPHVHLPPERRRIGIVPQEGVLFPHLDGGHNVGCGLRRRAERERRVAEMLDLDDYISYGGKA